MSQSDHSAHELDASLKRGAQPMGETLQEASPTTDTPSQPSMSRCPALPYLGNSWIISESGYRVWWFSLKLLHINEVTCRALLFTTRAFSQSWLPCYIWIMKISPDPLSWMHGSIVNMLLNYLLNTKLSALFLQIPNEKEDSYI